MPQNPIDKVKDCRSLIDKRKAAKARAEGQREQLLKQLNDDFGLGSLVAAEAEADRMQADVRDKKAKLADKMVEVDDMMEKLK